MELIKELELLGADVNEALGRLAGKTAFYERLLKKLPDTVAQNPVMPLLDSGDFQQALANAHALKGVFGNLSLTPLFKAYSDIVAQLRADDPAAAKQTLTGILDLQEQMLGCIGKYL